MILYKNTFDNIKTVGYKVPIEDSYYCKNNFAVVADGITRDPNGIKYFDSTSFEEKINNYPNPSGASMAANLICKTFEENYNDIISKKLSLKEAFIMTNKEVKKLNNAHIKVCDYLENDYYGAVGASALIENNNLYYSYICDCGVAVFNNDGKLVFKTEDDMEKVNKHFDTGSFNWNQPEARIIVRKDYRNNPNNKYSYGAITGEREFEHYLKEGSLKLNDNDIVIVYSDGFTNYLFDKDFYNNLINLINKDYSTFQNYLEKMGSKDYRKYGKEKTLVVIKNG